MIVLLPICLTKKIWCYADSKNGSNPMPKCLTLLPDKIYGAVYISFTARRKLQHEQKHFFVTSNHPYKKSNREFFFSRKSHFRVLPDNCLTAHFWPKTAMLIQKILESSLCAPRSRASWIPIPMGCLYPNLGTGDARVSLFLTIAAWHHQNPKWQAKKMIFFTVSRIKK